MCPTRAGETAQLGTPAGRAALQRALQAVLDHYRNGDIAAAAAAAAARRRRRRPVALELGLPPTAEALLPSRAASHIGSDSGWFDAVPVEPVEMQSDFDDDFSQTPPPAPPAAASTAPKGSEPAGAAWNGAAAGAVAGSPLRDAAGQQAARPDAAREGRAGDPAAREGDAVGGPARPAVDLSRMGPLALTLEEVLDGEGEGEGQGRGAALLAVSARRSTTGNSGGLSSVDGWPIRCGARACPGDAMSGAMAGALHACQLFRLLSLSDGLSEHWAACQECPVRRPHRDATRCNRWLGQEQSSGACRRVKQVATSE